MNPYIDERFMGISQTESEIVQMPLQTKELRESQEKNGCSQKHSSPQEVQKDASIHTTESELLLELIPETQTQALATSKVSDEKQELSSSKTNSNSSERDGGWRDISDENDGDVKNEGSLSDESEINEKNNDKNIVLTMKKKIPKNQKCKILALAFGWYVLFNFFILLLWSGVILKLTFNDDYLALLHSNHPITSKASSHCALENVSYSISQGENPTNDTCLQCKNSHKIELFAKILSEMDVNLSFTIEILSIIASRNQDAVLFQLMRILNQWKHNLTQFTNTTTI